MNTSFMSRLTKGALVEQIFTIVIILSMLISWVWSLAPVDILSPKHFMEYLNDMTDGGDADIPDDAITLGRILMIVFLVCIAICITNVILKFYRRSRWLSVIVILGAACLCVFFYMLYLEAKNKDEAFSLGTGFYVCAIGVIGLLVGLFVPSKPLCENQF